MLIVKLFTTMLIWYICCLASTQANTYGQLSSLAYDHLFPEGVDYEDIEFFRSYLKKIKGPALEIGSGNGRLLLIYNQEGLNVEGLDSSLYMIERNLKRAAQKGIEVTLHHQRMEKMSLSKVYDLIYIPYGTFMLVSDTESAKEILQRCYEHLSENGKLIITFCIPTTADAQASINNQWHLRGEYQVAGKSLMCWEKDHFDLDQKTSEITYRYELYEKGNPTPETCIEREEETLSLRWFEKNTLKEMLSETGFKKIDFYQKEGRDFKFHNQVFVSQK